MNFLNQQRIFAKIVKAISAPKHAILKQEFNTLVKQMHLSYDSKINENKFIAGHGVEWFLFYWLKAMSFKVEHKGNEKNDWDLKIANEPFSIKFNSNKPASIRLINFRGAVDTPRIFNYATISIIGGLGIGYFDPTMINEIDLICKNKKGEWKDGMDIKVKALLKIWQDNKKLFYQWKELCSKSELQLNPNQSKIASKEIAELLIRENTKETKKYL